MRFPLLLDTYGTLLTDRKRELLDYYYNEDYSLSEISELTGISRQGVRDSVKKSEEEILKLESKLKIVQKNEELSEALSAVLTELEEAAAQTDTRTGDRLRQVMTRLSALRQTVGSVRNDTEYLE